MIYLHYHSKTLMDTLSGCMLEIQFEYAYHHYLCRTTGKCRYGASKGTMCVET